MVNCSREDYIDGWEWTGWNKIVAAQFSGIEAWSLGMYRMYIFWIAT